MSAEQLITGYPKLLLLCFVLTMSFSLLLMALWINMQESYKASYCCQYSSCTFPEGNRLTDTAPSTSHLREPRGARAREAARFVVTRMAAPTVT